MKKPLDKREVMLFENINKIISEAKSQIIKTVNTTMVSAYFEIGRMIVEYEQGGKERAEYGKETLKELSFKLSKEFGKGFSLSNIKNMKQFFITYRERKSQSLISQSSNSLDLFDLSWTHYLMLIRIEDELKRKFYEIETKKESWSVRELKRQIDSALFERIALSKDKDKILELAQTGQEMTKAEDIVKDPYVLEFLGLEEKNEYSETEFEQAIINNLQKFLLELGKGFAFVARQKRISFDERHFYIDLVFYNRLLKSFVIIDLKKGDLKHQDVGQMQMYVNYYDREVKTEDENKTIGIILCMDKSDMLVKFTLPEENDQIFASKYKLYLPSKEELVKYLEVVKNKIEN
ncbi:MAG: PDDEXK nuclease domain-containing protein [bacterium]